MKLLKYLMRLPVLVAAYIGLAFLFFISNCGIYRLILKLGNSILINGWVRCCIM